MSESAENRRKIRRLAQDSLYFFCRAVLGFDYMVPHVHGKLCNFLQHEDSLRKQITLPRGFLKTTLSTIGYPMWKVLPKRDEFEREGSEDPWHNPNHRILIEQNLVDNARKRINVIRTQFESNALLQELFPEIIPDNFRKTRWSDSAAQIRRNESHPEATFEAAGVGSATTSLHYTTIIEDDIIAAKKDDMTGDEAIPTREEVDKAIGLHKLNPSLLVNQKYNEILNIGTRWANFDVIQHIIDEQMPPYVRFAMSVWDKNGNPTYPERFDKDVLKHLKAEQGSYIFGSQYENNPVNADTMVFPIDKLGFFEDDPDPRYSYIFMMVDPAISKKSKADYTSIMCIAAVYPRRVYVLEYTRQRMDPTQQINEIISMATRRRPRAVYIESVAYQQALAHFTRQEAIARDMFVPVEEYRPGNQVSKEARIRGIQPIVMRGDFFLKKHHGALQQELRDFPYCVHDDLLDTLSIGVRSIIYPSEGPKLVVPKDPELCLNNLLKQLREKHNNTGLPFESQVDVFDQRLTEKLLR